MSASVVVRRIRATPARSASDAWSVITELLTPKDSPTRHDLVQIGGIAMALIASEAPRSSPIFVAGVGPRLRFYCLYDDDAVLGESASEESLSWDPTDGDWSMSLPCLVDDLDWVTSALAAVTVRVTARDADEVTSEAAKTNPSDRLGPIDVKAFLRP